MSQIYVCDICGKVNPRSIRRIRAENPDVSDKPLNKERYYGFNLFSGDFCEGCLHLLERTISMRIVELQNEFRQKKEEENE